MIWYNVMYNKSTQYKNKRARKKHNNKAKGHTHTCSDTHTDVIKQPNRITLITTGEHREWRGRPACLRSGPVRLAEPQLQLPPGQLHPLHDGQLLAMVPGLQLRQCIVHSSYTAPVLLWNNIHWRRSQNYPELSPVATASHVCCEVCTLSATSGLPWRRWRCPSPACGVLCVTAAWSLAALCPPILKVARI